MKTRFLFLLFASFLLLTFWNCKNTDSSTGAKTAISVEEEMKYLEKGKLAASATFAALSQQLQKAVKAGGVPNAIQYCNTAAYPITNSLSQIYQAQIRRTSTKNRNPRNVPSTIEKAVLVDYAAKIDAGKSIKPIVKTLDEHNIVFYAPIFANDFCLKCHGKIGETLADTDYQLIQKYYPKDKASGYIAGELRGIWSIQFKKE